MGIEERKFLKKIPFGVGGIAERLYTPGPEMPSTQAETPRPRADYRYDDTLPAESTLLKELLADSGIEQLFDSFYQLLRIPVAIIDRRGNVLFSSPWQRICTEFYRVHSRTCASCLESDTNLATQLDQGADYVITTCPNGLTDSAARIVIDGKYIANTFIGQFFTRPPDESWFRQKAEQTGFDVAEFLAAMREIPIVDDAHAAAVVRVLTNMSRIVTQLCMDRKRALDGQQRLSIILDTIPQAVFWKDRQGRYLGCNARFAEWAGAANADDVAGKTDFDLAWQPDEAEAFRTDDAAIISSRQPKLHVIEPLHTHDGSRLVVDTSKAPILGTSGEIHGILGISADVTAREAAADELRHSKDELQKANRALRTIVECRRKILQAHDEKQLLQQICEVLVDAGGYRMAWFGAAEEDGTKRVRPLASAGYDDGYLGAALICWDDSSTGCGPTGTAIRTRLPAVNFDFTTDPKASPWRTEATRRGYASSISLPLLVNGAVLGALTIYSTRPNDFQREEVQLLTDLTNDVAFGVIALRTKAERLAAEQALRKAELQYRSIFENAFEGIFRTTAEGRCLTANPAAAAMLGYNSAQDGIIHSIRDLGTQIWSSPEERRRLLELVDQRGEVRSYECRFKRTDGRQIWVSLDMRKVKGPDGATAYYEGFFQDVTERRSTQAALRDSEEKFRTLFVNGPDALYFATLEEGKILDVNATFETLWGYSKQEVLGRTSLELNMYFHPADRARVVAELKSKGQISGFQMDGRRKNGEVFPLLLSITTIMVGDVAHILGAIQDMTETRRAEEEAKRHAAWFRASFMTGEARVVVGKNDGRIMQVNDRFLELYGYGRDEVLGTTSTDLGMWAIPEQREEMLRALETEHRVEDLEVAARNKEGRVFPVLYSVAEVEFEGKPLILGAIRDLTSRKAAEKAALDAEKKFRNIFEGALEGIFQISLEGRILAANPMVARLLGYETVELLMREVADTRRVWVNAADGSRLRARIEEYGFVSNFESEWRRRDGTTVWVSVNGRSVPDSDGGTAYLEGFAVDITERKRAERSLKESNVRLHQLSRDLLRTQDYERRRIARELHDSTSQLLAALAMNLSRLRDPGLLPDRKQQAVSEAFDLAQTCAEEIRTVTYLLHPPLLDEFGLEGALRSYAQGFTQRTGIQVEIKIEAGFGRLNREVESALFRIAQEALANIHKHSGSPLAVIRLERRGGAVELIVQDRGRGLPPALRREGGFVQFGVGLMGMRERAEQLGGTLQIDSNDAGARITAILPAGEDREEDPNSIGG